jgi:hypothetical protein
MCGDGSLKHGNMALASTTMVRNSPHLGIQQHFAIFRKLVYWINLLLIQVLNLSIRKLKILLKTNLLVELTSVVVSNMRKKNSEKMKMEKRRWVN